MALTDCSGKKLSLLNVNRLFHELIDLLINRSINIDLLKLYRPLQFLIWSIYRFWPLPRKLSNIACATIRLSIKVAVLVHRST